MHTEITSDRTSQRTSQWTSQWTSTERPSAMGLLARGMAWMSSLAVWGASAVVYAGFAAVFFASDAGFAIPLVQNLCGQAPPDMRFTSTAAEVQGFLEACGPAGREAYRAMQVADLFYPFVFAVFLASSLALALRLLLPSRPGAVILAAVAFLPSAFDYCENACAWLGLAAWPQPRFADALLGLFSASKTTMSWLAGTLLLLVLVALTVTRCRGLAARYRHRQGLDGRR
jgi:hypothetical protein